MLTLILIVGVVPALAAGYEDMLQKANDYIAAEEYEKAHASYQLAQRVDAENETAYLGEEGLYLLQGDTDSALALVDIALEKQPLSANGWLLKCQIDLAKEDVSECEADSILAEVCGVSFEQDFIPIAVMFAKTGNAFKAIAYFSQSDFSKLTEEQRELYRHGLVANGQRKMAEELGLAAKALRNAELDALFQTNSLKLKRVEWPNIL